MSLEMDNLLIKGKIDIEHLRIMKTKQSFEAVFIVMVAFSVIITIGDIAFNNNKQNIEKIKTNAQKALVNKNEYGFDSSINMSGLRMTDYNLNGEIKKQKTAVSNRIKVTVKSGDNIYILFKRNGLQYSKKNLDKVKKLNHRKNLRILKIGEEIILPVE